MPTYTPNYDLAKPLVNNPVDEDLWGDGLNDNMDKIDAALTAIATSGSAGVPSGAISMFGGAAAPSGWILCDGQAVSRATFSDLFTAIGVTFGVGDGATTFNVPDFRGRVGAGKDNMGGTPANRLTNTPTGGVNGDTLGNAGGAQGHQLTSGQGPTHNHVITVNSANTNATLYSQSGGTPVSAATPTDRLGAASGDLGLRGLVANNSLIVATFVAVGNHTHTASSANSGSGDSHNNVQPTIIVNYIIKT